MKRLSILFTLSAIILVGSSCTAQAPKAKMTNEVDSLSYAIGLANTQGLKDHLAMRMGVDTAYMADFIKGFIEGSGFDPENKKQAAYMAGIQIGNQIGTNMTDGVNQEFMNMFGNDSTKLVNKANMLAGFIAGVDGKNAKMTIEEANEYFQSTSERLKRVQLEKQYGENREAGIKFLEENKSKEGVVTLPSGLQYKIITEGKGAIPTAESTVKVNYRGTLIDGTEFDSSYKRNMPAEFGVTGVIKGWTQALELMPVGSKWELYVPEELAYGPADRGTIKPFSALIFEVELLEIVK